MKFLVTGAAGFIGANLSARLKNSGFDVLGVDNFSPYYSQDLKESRSIEFLVKNQIEFKRLDICDMKSIHSIVTSFKPQTIIHLAAQPGVRIPLKNSDQYIQNNLVAYSNILQISVETKVPNFLYASSSSVYGNAIELPYREDNLSIAPLSVYGATKLCNEVLAKAFVSMSATKARGMRFFTVYGPWGRPDMAYFRIIDAALNGSEFTRFGNGHVKRDFTYVDDVSSMIVSLALQLNDCSPGYSDVVNIGGGQPYSLNDLIQIIANQTSSKINVSEVADNPSDIQITSADVTRMLGLIGRIPEVKLELGIENTIRWAKQSGISEHLSKWIDSTM